MQFPSRFFKWATKLAKRQFLVSVAPTTSSFLKIEKPNFTSETLQVLTTSLSTNILIFDILIFWYFDNLIFWYFDMLICWYFDILIFWYVDILIFWFFDFLIWSDILIYLFELIFLYFYLIWYFYILNVHPTKLCSLRCCSKLFFSSWYRLAVLPSAVAILRFHVLWYLIIEWS